MEIDRIGKIIRNFPDFPGKGLIARKVLAPFIRGRGIECEIEMKNPGGGRIFCNLDEPLPWNLFVYGSYRNEKSYESFMLEKVKNSGIIFDVGANIGYYTVQFARLINGWVYAFEPMAKQNKILAKNLEINNITNTTIVKSAVSNNKEIKRIFLTEHENSGTSSIEIPTNLFEDVECITIDEFSQKMGIENIDIIKIDIEGHELKALEGMKRMLNEGKIRDIFIEIHTPSLLCAGTTPKDVCAFLQSFDYFPHSIKTGKIEEYNIGNDESLVYFFRNR